MLQVSDGIILKYYKDSDAAALIAVINENRTYLRPWISWIDPTMTEQGALEVIKVANQDKEEQRGMSMGIFKDEKLIGGIGMHHWDHQLRKAEIGFWISEQESGKGYMQQCARVFINFLFKQLGLNKIELHHMPLNNKSAALAKALHFKLEGIIRESFLFNGQLKDIVIHGLLQKEWQQIPE